MSDPTEQRASWLDRLQKDASLGASAAYLVLVGGWEVLEGAGSKVHARLPGWLRPKKISFPSDQARAQLQGKVCIVTGANAGVGEATAAELLSYGAHVVLACRSAERAQVTLSQLQLRAPIGGGQVEAMSLDLGSLHSVREFAHDFKSKGLAFDVLINNAGIMAPPKRRLTADGYEEQFQVNHLGHFLLTQELLKQREHHLRKPQAKARVSPARVINLTSMVHMGGYIHFDDLHWQRRYNAFAAYAQSKLANVLFTKELQRRHDSKELVAIAVHPGLIDTKLARDFFRNQVPGVLHPVLDLLFPIYLRTTAEAVENVMLAVLAPTEAVAGKYIAGGQISSGGKRSDDVKVAERLWDVSEELVGLRDAR